MNPLELLVIASVATGMALGWGFTILFQRELHKRKSWLVRVNTDTGEGLVQRVRLGREGYQIPGGPFVKSEGQFIYRDRRTGNPILIADENSGKAIRVVHGEAELMDGVVFAAASASRDIESIALSQGNWLKDAMKWIVVGGVIAVLAILGGIVIIIQKFGTGGGGA
jgi:hypothetical protein